MVGNFNAHLRDCLVLFADEAFFAGDKRHESVLKTLVTEEMIAIEAKGYDVESNPNFVHLIMASNEEWVVPAGPDERRFYILDVGEEHKQDTDYFKAIDQHMVNGGFSALLYYLMHYDLSEYNVFDVPQTEALSKQKEHTLKSEEDWWYGCLMDGDLTGDGDGWPDRVLKKELHLSYINAMRDLGGQAKRLSPNSFTRFIKRVCPKARSVQVKQGDTRPYAWELPRLNKARKAWDEKYGKREWPDVTAEPEDAGSDIPF